MSAAAVPELPQRLPRKPPASEGQYNWIPIEKGTETPVHGDVGLHASSSNTLPIEKRRVCVESGERYSLIRESPMRDCFMNFQLQRAGFGRALP